MRSEVGTVRVSQAGNGGAVAMANAWEATVLSDELASAVRVRETSRTI